MMKSTIIILFALLTIGCSTHQPIKTADYVEINRFMGKWYVIANIPTFIEKNAFNAVETYRQNEDGTIATTFQYNKGGFDGELVEYHPVGTIVDKKSNAIWKMQFIWPFKADYRVMHIDEDYSITVIGRTKRDYVWIMARTPEVSDEMLQKMLEIVQQAGYDPNQVQIVPQRKKSKNMVWRT